MFYKLVEDFILSKRSPDGCGFLMGFPKVQEFSTMVNRRQRRRFQKNRLIPTPFILFLQCVGVTFIETNGVPSGMNIGGLTQILISHEGNNPLCRISNERFHSLVMHLDQQSIQKNAPVQSRLVTDYHPAACYR